MADVQSQAWYTVLPGRKTWDDTVVSKLDTWQKVSAFVCFALAVLTLRWLSARRRAAKELPGPWG